MRKTIFWAHLSIGFVVGIVVFVMSATGVLLTYESQVVDFAVARAVAVPSDGQPLGPDAMVAAALDGGAKPGQGLVLPRDPTTPAKLTAGRRSVALDPYTGVELVGAGASTRSFFSSVTSLHRWLSTSGSTEVGGSLIDASNLLFLFLVLSGLYLWLPPAFRWTRLKMQLLFRRGLPTTQARHYNWHHVFGIWALIPLFFIVLSGVVMSYGWASNLMYVAVGEQPPQGRGRPGGGSFLPAGLQGVALTGEAMTYAELLGRAAAEAPDWRRVTIVLPAPDAAYLQVTMDEGNGAQNALKTQVVLDRATGEVVMEQSGATGTLGSRLRGWFRFVHTGEIYGVLGQTVAGLASFAAIVLVYTGFSLGIRRLSRMWRQRRRVVQRA